MRGFIFPLIVLLTFICHSQFYSQIKAKEQKRKEHRLRVKENSRHLSLKAKDLKTVEKNGMAMWTVKTVISNHSKDTLFYFAGPNCEPANFMLYTEELIVWFDPCDPVAQTVIAIPPQGERTIELEIRPTLPGKVEHTGPTLKFKVILWVHRAKDKNERITTDELVRNHRDRDVWLWSNALKITWPFGNRVASLGK